MFSRCLCFFFVYGVLQIFPGTDAQFEYETSEAALSEARDLDLAVSNDLAQIENTVEFRWQNLLTSAPVSICLLGQLVVMSAGKDFRLTVNTSQPGSLLKYPRFRPTIVQVSNEAWSAFNRAHSNMDRIRLSMKLVPSKVRSTLEILRKPIKPKLIAKFVNILVKSIKKSAEDGIELAQNTSNKFLGVHELLAEVIEVLAMTQGASEEQLRIVLADRKAIQIEKDMQMKREKRLKRQQKLIEEQLRSARISFEESIRSIPVDCKSIAASMYSYADYDEIYSSMRRERSYDVDISDEQPIDDMLLVQMADTIRKNLMAINESLHTPNATGKTFNHLHTVKQVSGDFKRQIRNKRESQWYAKVNRLLDETESSCAGMMSGLGSQQSPEFSQFLAKLRNLIKEAKSVAAAKHKPQSDGRLNGENQRYVAAVRQTRLQELERRYDELNEKQIAETQKMTEIMQRLARVNLEEISFDEILELLRDALKCFGELKENWSRLVRFFESISNIAKQIMGSSADDLSNLVECQDEDCIVAMGQLKDQTARSAISTAAAAEYLHSVAAAYVNVSSEYLVDRLAGLSRLLGITNSADQKSQLSLLQQQSEAAQASVNQICLAHTRMCRARLTEERLKITQIFGLIGEASEEDRETVGRCGSSNCIHFDV